MGATKVGKTLGNFRILECLGSGGSGLIWKAEDLALGRLVALKALRAELAADGDMSLRFREEARTLAKLSHANVASLYSFLEDDDGLFLVLEYVEGNTLAALLATAGPLPLDTAFALFHQVLDGVGHAHDAGIVHRDLKPANLMVDARGRIKVMDFGIARVAGAARTTHHGKLVGTPEYMSPEQVRGLDATIRSDLYALGVVLFEMVTGQPPFRAAASFELMRAQLEQAPPDPRTLRPELGEAVSAAILRCLAKRPADRFATTRELQDALLEAGATRRSRSAPVWREMALASAASEAPTMMRGATPPPSAAATLPAGAAGSESHEVWERAVDALDDDIDAALAGAQRRGPREPSLQDAPKTIVMDTSQDTARLEASPTRMLDDAPFAAQAEALAAASATAGDEPSTVRASGLLWTALAAAAIALAFGAVRLRARDEAASAPALPAAHVRAFPPHTPAAAAAAAPQRTAED